MASPMMTRDAMQQLSRRILAMSTADEMRVNITSAAGGNTRFAAGDITTSGDVEDTVISITSTVGGRRASSTTNLMDDASLKRAVETAERLAKLSPVDPELVPELGPQQYQDISASNSDVSNLDAGARAHAVEQLIAAARAPGGAMPIDPATLFVAGFLDANSAARGIATSKGLFAYHASTDVSLSCTARTPDGTGSGYAADGGREWKAGETPKQNLLPSLPPPPPRVDDRRSRRTRPACSAESTGIAQSSCNRARSLYRHPRAARCR
jgi:predicted Zn-dependent protease